MQAMDAGRRTTPFPAPTPGASLLLSFRLTRKTVVIVGCNTLAASRVFAALEADANVVVVTLRGANAVCDEIRWRAQAGQLTLLHADSSETEDASTLERLLDTVQARPSLICITDTLHGADSGVRLSRISATAIRTMCESRRIPLNVADMPDLCDFTFNSTHRFVDPATNEPTSLQLGVTTNGQGCRLASRIRRDIVSTLPREIGAAVRKVGQLRKLGKGQSTAIEDAIIDVTTAEDDGEATPNSPVPQRSPFAMEDEEEAMRRRMRWVAQVSEYWPYTQIAALSHSNMASILDGDVHTLNPVIPSAAPASVHSFSAATLPGKIFLVGSGPGHPALLTLATHAALTKHAQLVLSDKLVPAAVLALIPSHVEIRIARKFPGNAEGAQQEMMEAAVEAACRGLNVVRLKQGDPMIYGRAGEEIIYFRSKGIEPIVVPGVTSAIAGPTFAGIPVTQRGAAENVIVTTGVGRQGKDVRIPGYERGRTVVMLMGVARLPSVVDAMLRTGNENGRRSGTAFPPHTPVAIIERASMPDQRVTYSTLADIVQAMTSIGEQRPPGMIVVGWAVLTLGSRGGEGDTTILDDPTGNDDEERIKLWLGTSRWRVSEGIDDRWTEL